MVSEAGDPIGLLQQRIETLDHEVQVIRSRLMRAMAGTRIIAGQITGVISPGVVIGPTIVSMLNTSGGSLADGDVVILDTANSRSVKTTTTARDPLVLGVVRDVNSQGPFANGSETPIQIDGWLTTLHVTGSVAAGAWLRTSTTVKLAAAAAGPGEAGIFARALTADSGGAVEAAVYGVDLASLLQIVTAKGDLLVGSAAGNVDNLAVGTDGQIPYADSGETLGIRWDAAPAAGGVVYIPFGSEAVDGQAYSP